MANFWGIKATNNYQLKREEVDNYFIGNNSNERLLAREIEIIDSVAVAFQGEHDGLEKSDFYNIGTSRNGPYYIYGSVELHNRLSLGQLLELDPLMVSEISDIDLILSSFIKWGTGCFNRLIGTFSFVIWDRVKNVLIGVVDHLGGKSLYYRFIEGGYFSFANRLRNLIRPEKPTIDSDYIIAYLLNCYQIPGKTVFNQIAAVPAGSFLTVKNDSIRLHKYWEPEINGNLKVAGTVNQPDLQLKHILFQAVEGRASKKNKNGILLSGGLDSSAIGCIANSFIKDKGTDLAAYSKVLKAELGTDCRDERKYIQVVSDHENLKTMFTTDVNFSTKQLLHEYYEAQYCFPLNPFAFLSRPLYQMVSGDGCKTLFTGFGGDETASTEGLTSLPLLLKQLYWKDLYINIHALSKNYNIPLIKIAKRFVLKPLLPETLLKTYRKIQGLYNVQALGNSFLKSEILQRTLVGYLFEKKNGYISNNFLDPRKEMLNRVTNNYFRPFFDFDEYLNDVYNVKQVHPFLDLRLIEFMLSIHPREYLLDGLTRSIFRRSVKGVIPEEIRCRKDKIPFNIGVPFSRCLVESKTLVKETLQNTHSFVWEIIDREQLLSRFHWLEKTIDMHNASECNWWALEIGRCINVAAFVQWHGV